MAAQACRCYSGVALLRLIRHVLLNFVYGQSFNTPIIIPPIITIRHVKDSFMSDFNVANEASKISLVITSSDLLILFATSCASWSVIPGIFFNAS